jgi:class 3 adenylate cyclase/tetratricopeptide (TPR) repeat protein
MICGGCGGENRPGARYCLRCGSLLLLGCAACGAVVPATASYCDACGRPLEGPDASAPGGREAHAYTPAHLARRILRGRAALEGERKNVTVLFADVKDSVDLSRRVGPEVWHRILSGLFERLAAGVHRFDGTVNQYTGDGIMALFGAPLTLEDHAQRACLAALHLREGLRGYAEQLQRDHGFELVVRTALSSGSVVVGKIGDDLRMDYTAIGDTTGLASRLQALARGGEVLLPGPTARAVAGLFELEDRGRVEVRGFAEPVHVFALRGAGPHRSRLDVARGRGLSRFVGREAERRILDESLERGIGRRGELVAVIGAAGLGKSRLCLEFTQECRGRGIPVLEARCVPHGRGLSLHPVLELLRGLFEIRPDEASEAARERVAAVVAELDPASSEDLPLLYEILDLTDAAAPPLALDADARERRFAALLRRILALRSERAPCVIWIEDLHWIDLASDTLLGHVVDAVTAARGLVLVTFRPPYRAAWIGRAPHVEVTLSPLAPDGVRSLFAHLAGADPSLASLRELLVEHAGGNPLFVEELVRHLAELGRLAGERGAYRLVGSVEDLPIPESIESVLAARIDRLPEVQKSLLQRAAVIGRVVPEAVLLQIADLPEPAFGTAVAELCEAELLGESAHAPELELTFEHPLTQAVAYRTQLAERRARLHGRVAEVLEAIHAAHLDENAPLLAHHFESAGDSVRAAAWHARAGAWIGHRDHAGAYGHWRRAHALLSAGPPSGVDPARLGESCVRLLLHGFRLGIPEAEVAAAFTQGREVLRRIRDVASEARLTGIYCASRHSVGDIPACLPLALETVRLAESTTDLGLRAYARTELVFALFLVGRLREAIAEAERMLSLLDGDLDAGRDLFGYRPLLVIDLFRAWASIQCGEFRPADAILDRVLRLALQHGPPETVGWTHVVRSFAAGARGEPPLAVEEGCEASRLGEAVGSLQLRALADRALGLALVQNGRFEEGTSVLSRLLATTRERRIAREQESWDVAYLALAALGLRQPERALSLAAESVGVAASMGACADEALAQLVLAHVLRAAGGRSREAEIEAALASAGARIEECGAQRWLPALHEETAELRALRGDAPAAEAAHAEALAACARLGADPRARRLSA